MKIRYDRESDSIELPLKKEGLDVELVNMPESSWTDFKMWYEMKG